mgnify:CR=1 FL=1
MTSHATIERMLLLLSLGGFFKNNYRNIENDSSFETRLAVVKNKNKKNYFSLK